MKYNIYNAGSLFTEAEVRQRLFEEDLVNEIAEELGIADKIQFFNPISNPFNDKSKIPTAEEIYEGDMRQIEMSKNFIFNLDNPLDGGVIAELFAVIKDIRYGAKYNIVVVMSDMRIDGAGNYEAHRVPIGHNQFVIGALMQHNIPIFKTSREAIEHLLLTISESEAGIRQYKGAPELSIQYK